MPTVNPSSAQARRLRDLIRDVKYAMFTTRSVDGTLNSRPLTTLQTEFDGSFWFIASADSLKAVDIEQRPDVNLGYAAPDDGRYVSVSGAAREVPSGCMRSSRHGKVIARHRGARTHLEFGTSSKGIFTSRDTY